MQLKKLIELVSDWQLQKENVDYHVRIRIEPGDTPSSTYFVFTVTRQVGDPKHWFDGNRAIDYQTLDASRSEFMVTNALDQAKALIARRVQTILDRQTEGAPTGGA